MCYNYIHIYIKDINNIYHHDNSKYDKNIKCSNIYIYICVIIRDNVTYEGLRAFGLFINKTQKRSCDTLIH